MSDLKLHEASAFGIQYILVILILNLILKFDVNITIFMM